MTSILIVGAGHASAQLCASLREQGHDGPITLVGAEPHLPYHRPPLSKTFVKDPAAELTPIRAAAWYAGQGVDTRLGEKVVAIDRQAREIVLDGGERLGYDVLVLATGARARRLPGLDGMANVLLLRDAADAGALRDALAGVGSVTVVGGGFIGLEFAATARALGRSVRVIEMAPRLLARAVSTTMSDYILALHRGAGLDIALAARIDEIRNRDGRVTELVVDGRAEPVELLVIGIGAEPNIELARDAGLACDNGIVVDERMRTEDPAILAIGDCTSFPRNGARMRLESVQNANDQARTAVATAMGRDEPYGATPWFWSEQGSMRLQIAGLVPADSAGVLRPGKSPDHFSVLHFDAGGALVAVESVNSPGDHMMARKLVAAGIKVEPARMADPAVALKEFLEG
ncbi:MAG: FAD-dependent oxidoreductase [Burkholderiaceae bacterium]|nr:FAD-dependent oxidoreductase [Burkholderiaceae bacterium]